jgi:hypothetical protein
MLNFITTLVGSLFSVVDKVVENEAERQKLKTKIQELVLSNQLKELESAAKIIVAEAQGHSWLQRNWRPLLMITIVAIIANNYLLVPYMNALFGTGIMLDLPQELWTLMTVGVGGYVGGRSLEKISDKVTSNIQIFKSDDSSKRITPTYND